MKEIIEQIRKSRLSIPEIILLDLYPNLKQVENHIYLNNEILFHHKERTLYFNPRLRKYLTLDVIPYGKMNVFLMDSIVKFNLFPDLVIKFVF